MIIEIGKRYPEITGPASDAFAVELRDVTENKFLDELVLDFQGTRIISSVAMSALFSTYQKLKAEGKNMCIINACEKVTHLLRMVNMADLLR